MDKNRESTNNLAASEIMSYANILSEAAKTIKLRGYKDNQISFEHNGSNINGNCTNDYCKIYSSKGGAVKFNSPDTTWLAKNNSSEDGYGTWVITGNNKVDMVGNDAVPDLVTILPWIDYNICIAINEELGLGDSTPPKLSGNIGDMSAFFTGEYVNAGDISFTPAQPGITAACIEGSDSGSYPPDNTYHFFRVLIAR